MANVIAIAKLVGNDIRSRSNAEAIRQAINECADKPDLDFVGVDFMSRSFTDELCNIADEGKAGRMTNMSDAVRTMYEVVKKKREGKRKHDGAEAETIELGDMESLSAYLSTI